MPFHFESIPSTQIFLKEHVLANPDFAHLEFALSDVQSGGMGRHGRAWISERGNLFLSLYLKNFSLPLTWIPHWIGVSLIDALGALNIPTEKLALKWPNDLMISGQRKTAGILCEKVGEGIVVGIGVNLLSAPSLDDRETGSICELTPTMNLDRFNQKVCEMLIRQLRHEPSLSELKIRYQELSALKPGQDLTYLDLQTLNQGNGKFVRFGDFGELVVLRDGKERSLYSEEIKVVL
jgi:biotin-[acetyl-CoA-carboxylase] ligase BirA-like protein